METDIKKLAKKIFDTDNEKEAKEAAEIIISMIPTSKESTIKEVLSYIMGCADRDLWKKNIVSDVAKSLIIKLTKAENPLHLGIKYFYQQIRSLNFNKFNLIPSVIQASVQCFILFLFILLWPYGIIPVIAGSLWQLIKLNSLRTRFQTYSLIEKMPYTIAIGIFFLIWIPFAILCLPFVVIGWFGGLLEKK